MLKVGFCLHVATILNFVGYIRMSSETVARRVAVVSYSIPLILVFSSLFYVALPDIVPDVELLQADMKMRLIPLEYLRCPLEENCLSPSADFLIRYYSCYDLIVVV